MGTGSEGPAAQRWRQELAGWAIPQEILDAAPEPPWHFSPKLFADRAEQALAEEPTTARRLALEALSAGGSVLDVGVGGGAASLPLAPPAELLVGVDESEAMLEAFTSAAAARGVATQVVRGSWPVVADDVPVADVVVCHHVLYNVADLVPFAAALTDHARRRVVVELSGDHPTSNLNSLWKAVHGLERPRSPMAEDAVAVLTEMGLDVATAASEREWGQAGADRSEMVAMLRRRLCVGPEHDPEIEAHLEARSPRRLVLAAWWDGQA